ncbi:MAG: SDR family NAD(P)-dependent oxidoreductase [Desulfatiglandales bacterium]
MKVLITGGCGFIGANLSRYLLEKGHVVKVFDNLSTGSEENLRKATAGFEVHEVIKGDIRDKGEVEKAARNVGAVVHLAGHTNVVDSLESPEEDFQINAMGTLNVLEACRKNGVKNFVYASSNAVVGEQSPPINEEKIPAPISPYGASKLTGESLCSAYHHSFGVSTVSLRFSNAYGQYSSHKTSVVAKFIRRVKDGKSLIIYGDGNQTRDFIYAEDICEAIYLSMNGDCGGEVFQVATGVETRVNDLARMVSDLAVSSGLERPEIHHENPREGEIVKNFSDIGKIRRLLGFEPQITLREGLKKTWSK